MIMKQNALCNCTISNVGFRRLIRQYIVALLKIRRMRRRKLMQIPRELLPVRGPHSNVCNIDAQRNADLCDRTQLREF